jgi:hypothetical protein
LPHERDLAWPQRAAIQRQPLLRPLLLQRPRAANCMQGTLILLPDACSCAAGPLQHYFAHSSLGEASEAEYEEASEAAEEAKEDAVSVSYALK